MMIFGSCKKIEGGWVCYLLSIDFLESGFMINNLYSMIGLYSYLGIVILIFGIVVIII